MICKQLELYDHYFPVARTEFLHCLNGWKTAAHRISEKLYAWCDNPFAFAIAASL